MEFSCAVSCVIMCGSCVTHHKSCVGPMCHNELPGSMCGSMCHICGSVCEIMCHNMKDRPCGSIVSSYVRYTVWIHRTSRSLVKSCVGSCVTYVDRVWIMCHIMWLSFVDHEPLESCVDHV